VSCGARIAVYPVRGRHNNGYDSQAGNSSLWTCDDARSNSDFVAGDHLGNDIWAAQGTPVAATVDGTLTLTGYSSYSGNKVTIKDGCGWYHFFCHLQRIAPGMQNGVKVKAGQIIGYVGKTGTASNGVVHLHYSLYPDGNYNRGINPWPYLKAVEKNVCGGTPQPQPLTKHWVDTFENAPGRAAPSTSAELRGPLNPGTNYVYCRKWGGEVRTDSSYNHWWMLTDLDKVLPGKSGRAYVSAYYLTKWGNDQAKDNSGKDLPNCP
jgi:murein DD-endopeptidase MepM/ murein hydrolase activator NlpD